MKKKIKAANWSTEKKRVSIRKENIKELQKILDGKKGSFRKTYKSQTQANDKVWSPNLETEKGLPLRAASSNPTDIDLCDVDKKFDAESEEMEEDGSKSVRICMSAASHTRSSYSRMATTSDEAEIALNEGLVCVCVSARGQAVIRLSAGMEEWSTIDSVDMCASRVAPQQVWTFFPQML